MVATTSAACSRPSSSSHHWPLSHWLCGFFTADSVAVPLPRAHRRQPAASSSSSSSLLSSSSSSSYSSAAGPASALSQLREVRDVFKAKEAVLQKKISQEVERAKEFTKSGNKQEAMRCLKRKRYYESQMNQAGSFQLRINSKERMLADHMGDK